MNKLEVEEGEEEGEEEELTKKGEPYTVKERKNLNGSKNGQKKSNKIDEFLKEIYYDTKNPASFSGVEKNIFLY